MANILEAELRRLARERWARAGVFTLMRALAGALALIAMGLGLSLLLDWPIRFDWLLAAGLVCIAFGAIQLLRPPLSPHQAARRLDRRFRLNEQLSTALEVGSQPQGIAGYLAQQAQRSLLGVRRTIGAQRPALWPELVAIVAIGLVIAGLLVMSGILNPPALPQASALPPLAGPVERPELPEEPFTPPPGSQPAPGQAPVASVPSPDQAALLEALADALREQSVTRPAAEALDQGDLAGAASALRELADQADGLSPTARRELGEALLEAANEIAERNPEAANQLVEQAAGLQGGDQAAAEALEQLAEALEQLGSAPNSANQGAEGEQAEQGQPGNSGDGAGQAEALAGEQRQQPSDRLNLDGVPLELDGGEGNQSPAEQAGNGQPSSNNGFTPRRETTPDDGRIQTGEDPLRIPADLRDVVQDYFTP